MSLQFTAHLHTCVMSWDTFYEKRDTYINACGHENINVTYGCFVNKTVL